MRFKLFSFFWGLQILAETSVNWQPILSILIPVAVSLLFRPSLRDLMALAALQIFACLYMMPEGVGNHWFLLALVNFVLVVCFIRQAVLRKIDVDRLLETVAPILRLSIVIVYFFTFFHKLNSGFLDPDSSCAVSLYQDTLHSFDALIPQLDLGRTGAFGLIFTVLFIEGAIPLFFLFSATHRLAILLGLLFHLALGVANYHFSLMVFGIYLFFLPADFFSWLDSRYEKIPPLCKRAWNSLGPVFILVFMFLFFFPHGTYIPPHSWGSPLLRYRALAWSLFGSALFVGYLSALWRGRRSFSRLNKPFRIPWKPLIVFPIIIFINGLSPYLGLKTSQSFAMFSNLVTEGTSNHLIIPKGAIQIFDYQDDLILLTDSTANSKALRTAKEFRIPIPYLELRRIISHLSQKGKKNIYLAFTRAGRLVEIQNAEKDPELARPLPWPLSKIVRFKVNRQLNQAGEDKCGP